MTTTFMKSLKRRLERSELVLLAWVVIGHEQDSCDFCWVRQGRGNGVYLEHSRNRGKVEDWEKAEVLARGEESGILGSLGFKRRRPQTKESDRCYRKALFLKEALSSFRFHFLTFKR
ncbi:hypothetical protein L596_018315 [Steinernema carpocapsae]|uniref:Uncharacterized protein n=1 Tax=Steinernema carpocapsae TaxID=34508 RepID=A0A4U5N4K6_STECR|nr:hypothetical protein L596_018315 [Steinernema carpocapsae]